MNPLILLAAFTFTITADSHLDENTSRELYERTLRCAAADKPAFHVDLGDTFMSEKQKNEQQYADQRRYFDLLKVPVHLVTGNHDGECGRYLDGTTNNLAMWSRAMRLKYFPEQEKNYYSWEQGNSLFVALDPYWFAPQQRRDDDNWTRTLGKEQYDWLKKTLETSKAKFKFVFIHQLVGGLERAGRGGVEAVPFFEWGGKEFNEKRPGWAMPIHQLLVTNHVSIVFHGHDHLYAKQDLDGMVYQCVPQPGDPRGGRETYSYRQGTILPSSGYLRVTVSDKDAKVEYVRPDGSIAHTYTRSAL
jgi:predicted phosphodiesterase